MPIPLASIFLIAGSFWQQWALSYWWIGIVLAVSLLMVSKVPYPKSQHILALPWWAWPSVAAAGLAAGYVAGWRSVPFAVLLIYVVGGPLYALALQRRAAVEVGPL
jgi:phosphatidylserine synthase